MEQKERNYSDEIDLRQLFSSIGDFFNRIGRGILRVIIGVRRESLSNKKIFVFSLLLTIGLAVAYKLIFQNVYESTILIRSSYMDSRYLENEIDKLNKLAEEEEERAVLQNKLKISKETAESIIEFELVPYLSEEDILEIRLTQQKLEEIEDFNPELLARLANYFEYENRRMFQILVKVKDPSVLDDLEQGLVQFLKTDDYVERRLQINRESLLAKRVTLEKESRELDSLKNVLFENFNSMAQQRDGGSNNVILSDKYLTNPLDVFSRDLEINDQIINIDRELFLEPQFEVIDGFTAVYTPVNPGWVKSIVIAIAAGIALAYIFIMFKLFNNYLNRVEKELA